MRFRRNPLDRPGLYFKGGGDAKIKDTADQKALAQIASQRWQQYQSIYKPAENRYINEMTTFDKPSRMAQAGGAAEGAVRGEYAQAIRSDVQQMTGSGINPASGAFMAQTGARARQMAADEANNVTQTETAIQDQRVAGMQNVVALGSGQATQAIAGMGETARASASEASQSAINAHNSQSARRYAAGTAGGMAIRTGMELNKERA